MTHQPDYILALIQPTSDFFFPVALYTRVRKIIP